MTAPIASGWSDCRVGLAPTGKRRLCTAHTHSGHEPRHKRKRLWYCKCKDCHRLSRHAIRYKGDLRTSSAVLDTPMSASRWSSSFSRSCLRWYRRSQPSAIPAGHASRIFQDHPRSGKMGEAAPRVLVELQVVLPQDMFHLRNGAKQRLAAGAHRAVVNGPSDFCIIPTFGAQAIVSEYQLTKSPCGLPRLIISWQYA
jgi:hypothetical protein